MKTYEGKLSAKGKKFAIIVSRFNEFITSKLLSGACDALIRLGAREDDIAVYWVPGAWEIPIILKNLLEKDEYDAYICLGAVIRGDTPHFDYVAAEVSKGIANLGIKYGKPVSFGVLTTDTIEQAIERAGTKAGNKGFDAAITAVEMINLLESM